MGRTTHPLSFGIYPALSTTLPTTTTITTTTTLPFPAASRESPASRNRKRTRRQMWSILFALVAVSAPISAQTQSQVQACGGSIEMTSYPPSETYTYSTTDTSFFDAEYSYDPALCSGVPVNSMTLKDNVGGTTYTCSLSQFGSSGVLTSVCNGPNGGTPVTR